MNNWGLYDMHGNVYEFTLDTWLTGTAWTSQSMDPVGPSPDQYDRHVAEEWYGFRVVAEVP